MTANVTVSQSIGWARPPLTRMTAFFLACCKTKRSSSAIHAASWASAGRLLGIVERDMSHARGLKLFAFGGTLGRGVSSENSPGW